MSIAALDAVQAFEACSASAALQAWDSVEHVIQERIGSRVVLVKRGKKEVTSLSSDFVWVVVDQPGCGQGGDPCFFLGIAGLCGRIGV